MKIPKRLATALLLWAPLGIAQANAQDAQPADQAGMASHSATYRLTLGELRLEGWAERSGGTMDVRFARDCFHWHLDRDLKFIIRFTDGRRTAMVVSERMRETLNGEMFWYWSRTTLNGNTLQIMASTARPSTKADVVAERKVAAEKAAAEAEEAAAEGKKSGAAAETVAAKSQTTTANAAGGQPAKAAGDEDVQSDTPPTGLVAVYSWPETKWVWLPEYVDFHFTALKEQLRSLQSGSLISEQRVFDGSFKDGALRVVYRPRAAKADDASPPVEGETELLDTKSWRFEIDYFPLEGEAKRPLRSSTMKMHANGVVSEMVIDLAPFSIKADITSIKTETNELRCR